MKLCLSEYSVLGFFVPRVFFRKNMHNDWKNVNECRHVVRELVGVPTLGHHNHTLACATLLGHSSSNAPVEDNQDP